MTQVTPNFIKKEKIEIFEAFLKTPVHYGGYESVMVAKDGGLICHICAKDEEEIIKKSTLEENDPQWELSHITVNWEDEYLFCSHCEEQLPPEYPQ